MTLSEVHKDMDNYLQNKCYCPNEIYDMSGFFFQNYEPDTPCNILVKGEKGSIKGTFVLVQKGDWKPQIIYFNHDEDSVFNATRVDATENNITQIKMFMEGKIEKMNLDEYEETQTVKNLSEILSVADAIMI